MFLIAVGAQGLASWDASERRKKESGTGSHKRLGGSQPSSHPVASVVGLRVDGMRDSGTIKEVFGIHAKAWGLTWEQFHDVVAGKKHRWRLAEMANVAAFMASDAASAMTGTTVNLSMGRSTTNIVSTIQLQGI